MREEGEGGGGEGRVSFPHGSVKVRGVNHFRL